MESDSSFAERLRSGERLLGVAAGTSTVLVEVLGGVGFDWLFIDAEYTPLVLPQVQELIRASEAGTASPVVRMNNDHDADIRQILDMGAAAVIVPLVKDENQAQRIVAAAKYPPLGERGLSGGRAQAYGVGTKRYVERANTETAIIVMVEDAQGLENVEKIAAVEGLDGIFVGTGDLSLSLGCFGDPMHATMQDAISRIAAAANVNGVALGAFPANREMYDFCYSAGFRFFLTALETALLRGAAVQRLEEFLTW